MTKKFAENPLIHEILNTYKKSELSAHLSFYEYCQVTMQVHQMSTISELVDQFRIDQSIRDNFVLDAADDIDIDEI